MKKNKSHATKHTNITKILDKISIHHFQTASVPDRDVQCGSATRCLELIGWVGLTGLKYLGVLGWIGFEWSCRTSRPRLRRKEQEMEVQFPHLQRRPLCNRSLPPYATALNPHCLRENHIMGRIRNLICCIFADLVNNVNFQTNKTHCLTLLTLTYEIIVRKNSHTLD